MINPNIQRDMSIVKDLAYIVVYCGPEQDTYQGIDVADFWLTQNESGNVFEILTTNGDKSVYFDCNVKIKYNNQTSISRQ